MENTSLFGIWKYFKYIPLKCLNAMNTLFYSSEIDSRYSNEKKSKGSSLDNEL